MIFKKKFTHFKALVITAGVVMGAAPTVAALAPAQVYAAETSVQASESVSSVSAAMMGIRSSSPIVLR